MKKIVSSSKSVKRIEDELNLPLEEVLHELYVVRNMSIHEIAKLLSLHQMKLCKLIREAGIYSRKLNSLISIL